MDKNKTINQLYTNKHEAHTHTQTHTQIRDKNRYKEKGEKYSTNKMDIDHTYTLIVQTKVLTSFRHRAVIYNGKFLRLKAISILLL
jgi:hypothetical protein